MDIDFEREDWLLVALALAVVVPLGYSLATTDQGFQPETEVEKYCASLAGNVAGNFSQIDSCRCIPPDQVNESRYDAPGKVVNATELFLLECSMSDGTTNIFPIRHVREGYGNTSINATTNTSVLQ